VAGITKSAALHAESRARKTRVIILASVTLMTLGTQVTAWMPWGDSFESPGKEIRGGTEPVNPSTSANTPAVHTGLRRYR